MGTALITNDDFPSKVEIWPWSSTGAFLPTVHQHRNRLLRVRGCTAFFCLSECEDFLPRTYRLCSLPPQPTGRAFFCALTSGFGFAIRSRVFGSSISERSTVSERGFEEPSVCGGNCRSGRLILHRLLSVFLQTAVNGTVMACLTFASGFSSIHVLRNI